MNSYGERGYNNGGNRGGYNNSGNRGGYNNGGNRGGYNNGGYSMPSLRENPEPLLCDVFRLIRDNADLTQCLVGPNGDLNFLNQLRSMFDRKVISPWLKSLNLDSSEDHGYWLAFISEGFLGIIRKWLENDSDVPPEEMAKKCVVMIRAGFTALLSPEQ